MSTPDIFISYAREDVEWVEPLATELERRGWRVFWDHRIPAGQTWRSHIGKALKQTRCVVVVWSEHAVESDWVIEEADQGKRRGVLVPVFRHLVNPPMGFGQIQAADLSRWSLGQAAPAFETFLSDLSAVLGVPVKVPTPIEGASNAHAGYGKVSSSADNSSVSEDAPGSSAPNTQVTENLGGDIRPQQLEKSGAQRRRIMLLFISSFAVFVTLIGVYFYRPIDLQPEVAQPTSEDLVRSRAGETSPKSSAASGSPEVVVPTPSDIDHPMIEPVPLIDAVPPTTPETRVITADASTPQPIPTDPVVAGETAARAEDDGTVCGQAPKAQGAALQAVIQACSRIEHGQTTKPGLARVLRYRGMAQQRSGNLPAAIADFDRTLELTSDDIWAVQGRAEAHEALGHTAQAIADYQHLATLRPMDTVGRVKIAELGATPPAPVAQALQAAEPTATQQAQAAPQGGAARPLAAPDVSTAEAAKPVQAPATPPPPTLITAAADDQTTLISKLQSTLHELGYNIAVTGRPGSQLRKAIDAFALDVGLPRGSEVDEELLAIAQAELQDRHQQQIAEQRELNRRAQSSLADLGYDIGDVDGAFGPRSRRALTAWLQSSGQADRGAVDQQLVAALEAAVARGSDTVAMASLESPPLPERLESGSPPPGAKLTSPTAPPAAAGNPKSSPVVQAPPVSRMTAITSEGCTPAPNAAGNKRIALVIGNSAYEHVTKLRNPRADAEDMSKTLCGIGFEVIAGYDLDRDHMDDKTIEFARRAATADLAFVYYSGHGIQIEGRNYLVPIDAQFEDRQDLRRLVRLDQLIEDTGTAKEAIVVVDASRNDPTQSTSLTRGNGVGNIRASVSPSSNIGSTGPGLAQPSLNPGTKALVAFATRPNSVAYDGKAGARNSPYVAAMLRHIATPDVEVKRMLGMVQDDVARETGNQQEPSFISMLGGDEVFLVATPPRPAGVPLAELTLPERRAIQTSLKWESFWPEAVDGSASPLLLGQWTSYQRMLGEDTKGVVDPEQAVALHRRAWRDRPSEPLPPINVKDVAERAGNGEAQGQREMGMIRDPLFAGVANYSKDRTKAKSWYEKAAAQGDQLAVARLGLMLAGPNSSLQDLAAAKPWLEQAAKAGQAQAALRLAELILDGPDAESARGEPVELLKVASKDPETDGFAAARLRALGISVAQ